MRSLNEETLKQPSLTYFLMVFTFPIYHERPNGLVAAQTLISVNILDSVYASHSDLVSPQGRYRTSQYCKKQPKKFWKTLKGKYKSKTPQSEILTADDLHEHFKTVLGGDDTAPLDPKQGQFNSHQSSLNPEYPSIIHPELDAEITKKELRQAVFHQKNNKSPGLDDIKSEIFKISFDLISPFLLKLYNRLFQNGEYPRSWDEGIIVPIFKGGDANMAQITGE